jgi:hypothetical protein
MAIKGNSSGQRTGRWDVLLTNLRPSLPDLPHLADDFKSLEALLSQARALQTQREDLRSQASALSKSLEKVLKEGDQIRARMGATLKGKFGFTDVTLGKYGIKPFAGRRRKNTQPATDGQGTQGPAAPATSPAPKAAAAPAADTAPVKGAK